MEHNHLTGLNPAQKEAVLKTKGPLLVLAGAGSGKTRVITHRMVELILRGVAPHNILAVTFTNKAATEMRERVMRLIETYPGTATAGHDSRPTVTTFHALGVRILREHHETLHLPRHFVIYDKSDSTRAIKKALEEAGYNPKQFEPRKIGGIISRAKGDALSRSVFAQEATGYVESVAAEVWERYERILTQEKALDFDDLLLKTLVLLREYPVIREVLTRRFLYIHVDEYQDTNRVQFEIVKLLAGEAQNICVVGDVDQNIYSWRGADIKNVLQFERNFPGATTVFLEENYRSTQTIISASNQIIAKNKNRIPKTVFTNNSEGEKITLFAAHSGADEAEYVVMTAKKMIAEGASPSSIAVLYRTNFQSRVLEEAFLNFNVPYQLLGTKFFERKEVKDILSFLRLAQNPQSTGDLARIANVPTRGIGKVTMLKMVEGNIGDITGIAREKIDRFYTMIEDITNCARTQNTSATIAFTIKRTGYEADLRKSGTEEDLERLENLRELVSLATMYDALPPQEGIEALMENAALQSDQDELKSKEEKDAVRLMTVHAAKGLEFAYVFITGMEEGLFPHERLDERAVDHEEERRLFYVALTRAQKKVYLTYAHTRTIFGAQTVNVPSSFLNDIDTQHISPEGRQCGGSASGYETTIFLD
jgi:DNA helicase II / ATP-dependent DNA helicase PcrA